MRTLEVAAPWGAEQIAGVRRDDPTPGHGRALELTRIPPVVDRVFPFTAAGEHSGKIVSHF